MRKNLKMLRVENDLTQDEMSNRLGVSRATYNKIEKGKTKGSIDFWLTVKKEFPECELEEMIKTKGEADATKAENHSE